MIIDTCINGTLLFLAVYLMMAIASSAIRYQPSTEVSESVSEGEPQVDKGLSDEEKIGALDKLTVTHLRKLASPVGIQWRNAYGKHKHMNKDELVARLVASWGVLGIDVQIERIG